MTQNSTPSEDAFLTVYRGEYSGNKGGRFWSSDPEFARQFTQTGQAHELLKGHIARDLVYRAAADVYAGDPDLVDALVPAARLAGYKAIELSEGRGQPNSIFVFDRTALTIAIPQVRRAPEAEIPDDEPSYSLSAR